MRTKQVRPDKLDFEFSLNICRKNDPLKKRDYISFLFTTTKIFENFVYKINVDNKINAESRDLDFNVEGLSAPVLTLASTGKARYEFKFYDFKHVEYCLRLTKQSKNKKLFKFKVTRNSVILTRRASNSFIHVTAEEEDVSENN